MVEYNCPRCGHKTCHKNDMKKHLNKLKTCKPFIKKILLTDEIKNNTLKNKVKIKITKKGSPGHIYIFKLREHILLKQNVYKVGYTERNILKRLSEYPKESMCYFSINVLDCRNAELKMIKLFTKFFKNRTDIGREYFEGSVLDMIEKINLILLPLLKT